MTATEETINYTCNYYWGLGTYGHRILQVLTGGKAPLFHPLRCPRCGTVIKDTKEVNYDKRTK